MSRGRLPAGKPKSSQYTSPAGASQPCLALLGECADARAYKKKAGHVAGLLDR